MTEEHSQNTSEIDREIDELTLRLHTVQLQHSVLAEEILGIQRALNIVVTRTRPRPPSPVPVEEVPIAVEAIAPAGPRQGDRVRILNPPRNSPSIGIVVSFTRDGLARIEISNGSIVRRATHNIEVIDNDN